jgi:thiamine-monophosphate kinase
LQKLNIYFYYFSYQDYLVIIQLFFHIQISSCCTDTSDGLLSALNTISDQSDCGYIINNIPYLRSGIIAAKLTRLPEELLFISECGEYELLFTIPAEYDRVFNSESRKSKFSFYKIGEITEKKDRIFRRKNLKIDLTGFNISARDYKSKKDYVKDIFNFIKGQF